MVGEIAGSMDGFTMDCWQCGWFYRGWAIEWVVVRLVILGSPGNLRFRGSYGAAK